ncbi:hypothetical protein PMAYCL1PPCAC_09476, partial [Pristionchus mayeri]
LGTILLASAFAAPVDFQYATFPPIATASAGMGNTEATTLPTLEGANPVDDDTINVEPIAPDETAAYNAAAIKYEPLIRESMRSGGLPEEAIDEFFALGLNLAPFTEDKTRAGYEWQEKWVTKVTDTEATTAASSALETSARHVFTRDEIITWFKSLGYSDEAIEDFFEAGLDKQPSDEWTEARYGEWLKKWEHTLNADTESTTATPSAFEEKQHQMFARIEMLIKLTNMGYSNEAIQEFFEAGLMKIPSDDETDARFGEWIKKWEHTRVAGPQVDAEAFKKFMSSEIYKQLKYDGYSHEALVDFFAAGLAQAPSPPGSEERLHKWQKKWNH